jgi:hypothetical protein
MAVAFVEIFGVGGNCWASTLRGQLHFRLGDFHGTGEEEESRSDNEEQDDIDGTGEVEHRNGKKQSRRRYMVTEL